MFSFPIYDSTVPHLCHRPAIYLQLPNRSHCIFYRTHTQGKCQKKLLHFKLVKAMLADQLLFYLERIYDLHLFGQFTDACDAVQVHHTHHLCQHTRKVQIDHQQIATEHTVRYVRILQHTSQTLDHHTPWPPPWVIQGGH